MGRMKKIVAAGGRKAAFAALLASASLLAGCGLRADGGEAVPGGNGASLCAVRGTLGLHGAFPSAAVLSAAPELADGSAASARTAIPSLPPPAAEYRVEVYADGRLYSSAVPELTDGAWTFECLLPAGTYRFDAAGLLDGLAGKQGGRSPCRGAAFVFHCALPGAGRRHGQRRPGC
ncbi:MAG: hypothetical protein K2H09_03430 [Treponemataceae bacterium]|nr:hypothetical protein [Treponemataceae bacterium]